MRPFLILVTASLGFAQDLTPEQLIEAGHWKRARAAVERIANPQADPRALFLRSQIAYAFGDRDAPLPLAEKAVQRDASVARYHRQLAEALGVAAQRANLFTLLPLAHRFRNEINEALAIDPRDTQAWRDLLEFYLLAPGIAGGDSAKAEAAARKIAEIDAAEGYLAQARIAEWRKDRQRQEAMLRRAAEVQPPSYRALIAAAEYDLAHGPNWSAAAALAEFARRADPGRAGAYSILAEVYAGQSNWPALEATLSSAATAVPDDLAPYYRAAARLMAEGREPERAERYLKIYLAQEPEGAEPTSAAARTLLTTVTPRLMAKSKAK